MRFIIVIPACDASDFAGRCHGSPVPARWLHGKRGSFSGDIQRQRPDAVGINLPAMRFEAEAFQLDGEKIHGRQSAGQAFLRAAFGSGATVGQAGKAAGISTDTAILLATLLLKLGVLERAD